MRFEAMRPFAEVQSCEKEFRAVTYARKDFGLQFLGYIGFVPARTEPQIVEVDVYPVSLRKHRSFTRYNVAFRFAEWHSGRLVKVDSDGEVTDRRLADVPDAESDRRKEPAWACAVPPCLLHFKIDETRRVWPRGGGGWR